LVAPASHVADHPPVDLDDRHIPLRIEVARMFVVLPELVVGRREIEPGREARCVGDRVHRRVVVWSAQVAKEQARDIRQRPGRAEGGRRARRGANLCAGHQSSVKWSGPW
jgi:hypothetical protein